ncbi:hypothetical protein DFJ63DRAFT_335994 [Scheffersomyces coipomensis]|uniref:uncharacterized protein n=1 Tax=Scheffersomyces coipomensis TaxID=1788519 RepID=UPI00315D364B
MTSTLFDYDDNDGIALANYESDSSSKTSKRANFTTNETQNFVELCELTRNIDEITNNVSTIKQNIKDLKVETIPTLNSDQLPKCKHCKEFNNCFEATIIIIILVDNESFTLDECASDSSPNVIKRIITVDQTTHDSQALSELTRNIEGITNTVSNIKQKIKDPKLCNTTFNSDHLPKYNFETMFGFEFSYRPVSSETSPPEPQPIVETETIDGENTSIINISNLNQSLYKINNELDLIKYKLNNPPKKVSTWRYITFENSFNGFTIGSLISLAFVLLVSYHLWIVLVRVWYA